MRQSTTSCDTKRLANTSLCVRIHGLVAMNERSLACSTNFSVIFHSTVPRKSFESAYIVAYQIVLKLDNVQKVSENM